MASVAIKRAKERLRERVSDLVDGKVTGSEQLWPLFNYIEDRDVEAFFFGGMLRGFSLNRKFEAPRDIDIVIKHGVDDVADHFSRNLIRKNSFGGLKLAFGNHQVDLWQLNKTWAFKQGFISPPKADMLPATTFLNLDALVIEVFPHEKRSRRIYERNFFQGCLDRTIEINLEVNPYPELCVVRSLALAKATGFAIGPRLNSYIVNKMSTLQWCLFEEVQHKHYGKLKSTLSELTWMRMALLDRFGLRAEINDSEQKTFIKMLDRKNNFDKGHFASRREPEVDIPNTEVESGIVEKYISDLWKNETSFF